MKLEKTCIHHGELSEENIIKENNKSKKGFLLRCRFCKLEKDRKYKESHVKQRLEYNKKWKEKNRESINAKNRAKNPKNREYVRAHRERKKQEYEKAVQEYKQSLMSEDIFKICKVHGPLNKAKIFEEKRPHGIYLRCKECQRIKDVRLKVHKRDKSEKGNTIMKSLRNYGLTKEKYENMIKIQDNKCAICGQEETKKSRTPGETARLCIDHCHKTGFVRGLLCHACNLILGASKDSTNILERCIQYLNNRIPEPEVSI